MIPVYYILQVPIITLTKEDSKQKLLKRIDRFLKKFLRDGERGWVATKNACVWYWKH